MRVLRPLAVLILLALSSCGSDKPPAPRTADAPTTAAEAEGALTIRVTEFGPGSRGVDVSYQVTNSGKTEARFVEDDLVLVTPGGGELRAFRDPGGAGFHLIDSGGTYVSGGTFMIEPFRLGHYVLRYAGATLAEKDI